MRTVAASSPCLYHGIFNTGNVTATPSYVHVFFTIIAHTQRETPLCSRVITVRDAVRLLEDESMELGMLIE